METDEEATVPVTVRSATCLDEIVVTVPASAKLGDVKKAVAVKLRSNEALSDSAKFVNYMPGGQSTQINDAQRLGTRRVLSLAGVKLTAAVKKKKKIVTDVDNFDEFDPSAIIDSPRSLRACSIEGVLPEALIYKPVQFFAKQAGAGRGVLARMRHDFFESFRQDTLARVRDARRRVMQETSCATGDSEDGSQRNAAVSFDASGASLVATGGIWGGPLAPASYPSVLKFFETMHKAVADPRGGKLFEGSLVLPLKSSESGKKSERFVFPSPKTSREFSAGNEVMKLSGEALEESEEVEAMVSDLWQLPFGQEKGEHVEGLLRRTEAAVAQRRKDARALSRAQSEERWIVERKNEMADYQREIVECELDYQAELREHIDDSHDKNTGVLETKLQETNFEKARKRSEYWSLRREAVCNKALDEERVRNEKVKAMQEREQKRIRNTQNLRELQKIAYSKKWIDRRARWSENYREVRRGVREWQKGPVIKDIEASARVEDQQLRMIKWAEVFREVKSLRRDFAAMANSTEDRKQRHRREAVSKELQQMALQAGEAESFEVVEVNSRSLGPEASMFSSSLVEGSKEGRSLTRGSSIGDVGGDRSHRQGKVSLPISPNHLASPGGERGRLPKLRGVPRFDFPRHNSDVISPLAAITTRSSFDSPALSLGCSASTPALVGGGGGSLGYTDGYNASTSFVSHRSAVGI